jgi:hypothetical protein
MKNKGRNIVLICAAGLLGFTSCKKDQIVIPESNEPVFVTEGTMGGEAFRIVAGDNGAFMHTMTFEENGVDVFSGKLSDGNLSIELGIYDGMLDMPLSQAVVEMLNITPSYSATSTQPLMVLSKSILASMSASQEIESIEWIVDGNNIGTNEASIYEPGLYNVCGHITFMSGGTAYLCNELIVGYTRNANFTIDFSVDQMSGMLTAGIDATPGSQIEFVNWFINDIPVTGNAILQTQLNQNAENLKAEVHFQGDIIRTKVACVSGVNYAHTVNDFTIFETLSTNFTPRDFNIRLRIEEGESIYLSERADNESSTMQITGIEYYGKNSNNKDVYKVSANLNAQVREVTSLKTLPVVFSTTFGVEVP